MSILVGDKCWHARREGCAAGPGLNSRGPGPRVRGHARGPSDFSGGRRLSCEGPRRRLSETGYKICETGVLNRAVRGFFRAVRVTEAAVRAGFGSRGVRGGRCEAIFERCEVKSSSVRAQALTCVLFPNGARRNTSGARKFLAVRAKINARGA